MSIEALLWHGDGKDEILNLATWQRSRLSTDQLLWIDVESPTAGDLDLINRSVALSDDARAALAEPLGTPDARVHESAVEVVVQSLETDDDGNHAPLQIVVGREWIVTRHDAPLPFLETHRDRIRDEREVGKLTAVQFLVSILDWHVDSFFRAADRLESRVDELDEAALRRDDDLLDDLVRMRRRVARVRRIVGMHRELFAELARPDFLPNLSDREASAVAQIIARVERASEAVAHAREMLIGTFDVHMTRTAQRTNDTMRVLTWASVILLPAVVIAGVMGMNFKAPLFDNPDLFYVVVGLMVLLAVGTLIVARLRGWL